jgi:hypothetical protein
MPMTTAPIATHCGLRPLAATDGSIAASVPKPAKWTAGRGS